MRIHFIRYTLLFSLAVTLSGCTEAVSFVAGVGTGLVVGQVLNVGDWFGGNEEPDFTPAPSAGAPTPYAANGAAPGGPAGGFPAPFPPAAGMAPPPMGGQPPMAMSGQPPMGYGMAPQQQPQPQFYAPQQQAGGYMQPAPMQAPFPPSGGYQPPMVPPAMQMPQPMGMPMQPMAPSFQGSPVGYALPTNTSPLPPAALSM